MPGCCARGKADGVLRPGGTLILQILNYEKILGRREKLLGRRVAGDVMFERNYEYGAETITFTITKSTADPGDAVKIDAKTKVEVGNKPGLGRSDARNSVTIRPLTRALLRPACLRSGFEKIEGFGGLALGPFEPSGSPDLVLLAGKPVPP